MKTTNFFSNQKLALFICLFFIGFSTLIYAQENYREYSGVVIDSQTSKPLVFASLSVNNSNISTISNKDGEFLLKIPIDMKDVKVTVSFLGYQKKVIPLSAFKSKNTRILLVSSITPLPGIKITLPSNAKTLVLETFKKKAENYINEPLLMTAFYRETIKKRKRNVSLAEAIVNVFKQPYTTSRKDYISLYKARKSTDYTKLDTLALKLQGGPFNALYIDLMKYPEYMFTDDVINLYTFSFEPSTTINERPVYVVAFKQREEVKEPLYYGKLFIDSKTLALTSAIYKLNVENKELTSRLFVKKKPKDVFVYPTEAAYRVDYREKNGKWYYGYSNVKLTFKIKRKRKLFNSVYSLTSEMAVTDWKINTTKEKVKYKERMRPSIIISDEASGFSDPKFWGAYNVIEPEKSIESAINKIKRQLKKLNRN
jgi:hypothetical protein